MGKNRTVTGYELSIIERAGDRAGDREELGGIDFDDEWIGKINRKKDDKRHIATVQGDNIYQDR